MPWRRPNEKTYLARLNWFKRFISDDVAMFMAWRLPKKSKAARRARALMRKAVLKRYKEQVKIDPKYTLQDAIDEETSDVIERIARGEEVDWALKYLASP